MRFHERMGKFTNDSSVESPPTVPKRKVTSARPDSTASLFVCDSGARHPVRPAVSRK